MILRDRLDILDSLMKDAKQVLAQYETIANIATRTLETANIYANSEAADPDKLLDIFRRIHDMQMSSLNTLNSVIERFPVEHTVQELQLLEIFRNLTERQKQTFMSMLETELLHKRQR